MYVYVSNILFHPYKSKNSIRPKRLTQLEPHRHLTRRLRDQMERLEEPSPRLRYFAACSVPLLLNATFLAALIYKLQYAPSDYSWFNVFAPFAAADLWTMLWRRDQLVDCLGSLCTKACVCLHLAGHMPVRLSAVAMCVPLWLSVLISSYYRIAVGAKTGFSVLVRSLYHLIFRVLQPLLVAMQLDGAAADWVVVLTPAWAGLVVCFSGALFLLYCAPVIRMHSLQELQAEATVLLFLCCLHLLCISLCGFLFVFW